MGCFQLSVSSVVTTGVLVSGSRDDELPPNDNETLYRNKTTKQTPMTLIFTRVFSLPSSSLAGSVAFTAYEKQTSMLSIL